jgi:hypothetical protein
MSRHDIDADAPRHRASVSRGKAERVAKQLHLVGYTRAETIAARIFRANPNPRTR